MTDIDKQIEYWRNGAREDWEVASQLVNDGKIRHGLFFAHLALEKLLKAHICQKTQDFPPRIHNLNRLEELADLPLDPAWRDILSEMNAFNLEGRYPVSYLVSPDKDEALVYLYNSEKVFTWLIQQL